MIGQRVVLAGLRRTAMWRRFEALLGRELCTDGGKACAAAVRGDVCAARAPAHRRGRRRGCATWSALGPDRFDLYDDGGEHAPRPGEVPMREYLQFLRGSGKHSIGSLAQLTDSFGRVVYDPSSDGVFRLAASWFPVPAAGVTPEACGDGYQRTVRGPGGGLCGVLRGRGTAVRAMRGLSDDPRIVLYGAKSGTIDSLGDVAEDPAKCARANARKTIAGRPERAEDQPYWLQCGKPVARRQPVPDRVRREDRPRRDPLHARPALRARRQGRRDRGGTSLHRRHRRLHDRRLVHARGHAGCRCEQVRSCADNSRAVIRTRRSLRTG